MEVGTKIFNLYNKVLNQIFKLIIWTKFQDIKLIFNKEDKSYQQDNLK